MRDPEDILDGMDADPEVKRERDAYIDGQITADELDQQLGTHLAKELYADEWGPLENCREDLRAVDQLEVARQHAIEVQEADWLQTVEAKAHLEDDPATSKSGLSNPTTKS